MRDKRISLDTPTLHCSVGIPRSGKSTLAKSFPYPRVEPDAIREVIHGTPYRLDAEPLVWATVFIMIRALFIAGHKDVWLDGCNQTIKRRLKCFSPDWYTKFHVVEAELEECIERAKLTDQDVLIPVIIDFHNEYEPLTQAEILKGQHKEDAQ